jgi:hypothetical protein
MSSIAPSSLEVWIERSTGRAIGEFLPDVPSRGNCSRGNAWKGPGDLSSWSAKWLVGLS